jgi:hypothetical protein
VISQAVVISRATSDIDSEAIRGLDERDANLAISGPSANRGTEGPESRLRRIGQGDDRRDLIETLVRLWLRRTCQ